MDQGNAAGRLAEAAALFISFYFSHPLTTYTPMGIMINIQISMGGKYIENTRKYAGVGWH